MLDSMLEFGRHLPILAVTLSFVPPSAWIRLSRSKRSFRDALSHAQMRAIAVSVANESLSTQGLDEDAQNSLHVAIDLRRRLQPPHWMPGGLLSEDEDAFDEAVAAHRNPIVEEAVCCEAVFAALLLGADVNEARPVLGLTPLMRAAEESMLRLCDLLLRNGADANLKSVGGTTALGLALGGPCGRCWSSTRAPWCRCPRAAVAKLLLQHTCVCLPECFASAVRMASQDLAYLPVVDAFVLNRGVPVDARISGPDCRLGTPLSVALERRVTLVEGALQHRADVVSRLLTLKADVSCAGPYASWWGSTRYDSLLCFAISNGCEARTLSLISTGKEEDRVGTSPT
eukprot:TRINITY_DN18457_c0_g1_i1.p1 TRINITY_DN18457_c0_g1~~TRINITY_DN18457_c0_g1_i1.p1  ORF type:complete len:343 (-),score=26.95 TRINITY_DN18457_c0_g1_i1:271-1299(-)